MSDATKASDERARRRHKWTLHLECDDHREFVGALRQLLFEAEPREAFPQGVSGGCGSGYHIEYDEDPTWTAERYKAFLNALIRDIAEDGAEHD